MPVAFTTAANAPLQNSAAQHLFQNQSPQTAYVHDAVFNRQHCMICAIMQSAALAACRDDHAHDVLPLPPNQSNPGHTCQGACSIAHGTSGTAGLLFLPSELGSDTTPGRPAGCGTTASCFCPHHPPLGSHTSVKNNNNNANAFQLMMS